MRELTVLMLMAGLLIAGCGREEEPPKVEPLHAHVTSLETELERQSSRNETLLDQLREQENLVQDLTTERNKLAQQVRELKDSKAPESTVDDTEALKQRITALEAELESLKQETTDPEPDTDPAEQPEIDTVTITRKMEELWPLVKAGDRQALGEMQSQLNGANKEIRDSYISELRDWVSNEPSSKHARYALAIGLATRFQDLTDPMQQGALAGEIQTETMKALEIDPEYYEAQHFLAILRVNYPSFTPEFKDADESLDKALELQSKLTWEDRFAEIYAAYGKWYRVQKMYDEANAKVQAGLDLAPRHQALLDEQQRIEDASSTEEE